MKLRRAMALAAATAVIAPAALFAAPAAYATDGPETTTTTTGGTGDDSATTGGTGDEATTGETGEQPATGGTVETPADKPATTGETDTEPAEEPATTGETEAKPDEEPATGGTETKPDDKPEVKPEEKPETEEPKGPVECKDDEENSEFDENLTTGLYGLPSKIVAGSGWHGFNLKVSNKSDVAYDRVDLGVFAASLSENFDEDEPDFTNHVTLQFKDPESGEWTDISLGDEDQAAGYIGYTDIKAKESFSLGLRLSVAAAAPNGMGFAISIGMYADAEGNCVYANEEENGSYFFDILAAGSKPGEVPDAKPQPGKKPVPDTKPQGDREIQPVGNLAETGSSSMLPTIGAIGGITILAGAGVMFAVKRRKGDEGAAA
ncbi:LAETG motif-containing sortase-dependent surface protein [Streptomyces sp. SYSU K21746]